MNANNKSKPNSRISRLVIYLKKRLYLFIVCTLSIVTGCLLLSYTCNQSLPYKIGGVLVAVGLVEIIIHVFFSGLFIKEIQEHLDEKLTDVVETTLKTNKEFQDAGLENCVSGGFGLEGILNQAIKYYQENYTLPYNSECEPGKDRRVIRIMGIFINDLPSKKDDFKKLFETLAKVCGCRFEILLPNPNSELMRVELFLRSQSRGLGNDTTPNQRWEDLTKTIGELEDVVAEIKGFVSIKYYVSFISMPIISFDKYWFHGYYLNGKSARDNYYLKTVLHYGDENSLAYNLKSNFYSVWDATEKQDIKKIPHTIEKAAKDTYANYFHLSEIVHALSINTVQGHALEKVFNNNPKLRFLTHFVIPTPKNTSRHAKNNYLAQWIITIGEHRINGYQCTLETRVSEQVEDGNKEPEKNTYDGFVSFDKQGNNILFVFNKMRNEKNDSKINHYPIIISGLIRENASDKVNKESVLLLHATFYNRDWKNTVTKIGALYLKPPTGEYIPTYEEEKSKSSTVRPYVHIVKRDNEPGFIEITPENKSLYEDSIYQLLLRRNKVVLQSPHFQKSGQVINDEEDIKHWRNQHFKDLKGRDGEYVLGYLVSEDDKTVMHATLHIYNNGLVTLKRKQKVDSSEEEIYHGDINFRYKGASHNGVVFIKLIRTQKFETHERDYRELFLVLNWRAQDGGAQNYTRGIILGDRDKGIFHLDRKVVEAARCVIYKVQKEDVIKRREDEMQIQLHKDRKDWNRSTNGKSFEEWVKEDLEVEKLIKKEMTGVCFDTILKKDFTEGTLPIQYDESKCE